MSRLILSLCLLTVLSACLSPTGSPPAPAPTPSPTPTLLPADVPAATGNTYDFVAYSATKDNACISLTFTLHSSDQANAATPLPSFDKTAESAVFDTIMSTFSFGQ